MNLKQLKTALWIFIFSISQNAYSQFYFENNSVRSFQKIHQLIGPYVSYLVRDSIIEDSTIGSAKFYTSYVKTFDVIYDSVRLKRIDTNQWQVDSNRILFSGNIFGDGLQENKSYKNAVYWQFKKSKGDTVFTDFIDRTGNKFQFVIDSVYTSTFYGINRQVSRLKHSWIPYYYIEGIGYSFGIFSVLFYSLFENPLLVVCKQNTVLYWKNYDQYSRNTNPLKTETCNFDTLSIEFAKYHTAKSNSIKKQKLEIYPNPCSDKITVTVVQNNSGNFHVSVFDINGKIVFNEICNKKNQILINTTTWIPGIFYLQIIDDLGNKSFQKIVKL